MSKPTLSGSCSATPWITSPFIAFQRLPRRVEPSKSMSAPWVTAMSRMASGTSRDAVEESKRNPGLLRLVAEPGEKLEGLMVFLKPRNLDRSHRREGDVTDEQELQLGLPALTLLEGEIDQARVALGRDHDPRLRFVRPFQQHPGRGRRGRRDGVLGGESREAIRLRLVAGDPDRQTQAE